MKLSYISNIKLSESSGGMSGANKAVYNQLDISHKVCDYTYINPKMDLISKIKSKFLRLVGFKGCYHFFSDRRLESVNNIFNSYEKEGDCYFFLGFTPWIHINPDKPYYCYNDACFETYVSVYNNKNEFSDQDLNRIYNKERTFLSNAKFVFFNSAWAIAQTKKAYDMSGKNFINVGVGGFIDLPKQDSYQSGYKFLFISMDFESKGGYIVVKAIKKVRENFPNAQLWIVGDTPPKEILDQDGLVYKGFFNKSIEAEYKQLVKIFEETFCLVHPTKKDINPLVLIELAYFGCPAIVSNRFAIPEFVVPKKSGLLIDDPNNYLEVADKMCYMIENQKEYSQMREFTRQNAIENITWDKTGERLLNHMK